MVDSDSNILRIYGNLEIWQGDRMITLYSGTPGSGKSLHLAKVIWFRLRRNHAVIANFEINTDIVKGNRVRIGAFTCVDMSDLTVDFLIDYAKAHHDLSRRGAEDQTLLIIDECAVIFNSRAWNAKDRQRWITFFQQHRKWRYKIILVAQQDRMIDRQIRGFIEYEEKHKCVNNFKVFGAILGLLSGGKLFITTEYWYGMREIIGSMYFRLNRKQASIYNTYLLFAGES